MPLVWMSDCYAGVGYTIISRRYLMLTLVEDALRESGAVSPDTTGTYFRLVWGGGLSDAGLKRYAREIYQLCQSNQEAAFYPEWVLQELDQHWITQVPAPQEAGVFAANPRYIRYLLSCLGEPSGKILELLADYLLSCMPGCRTTRRQRSGSLTMISCVQWKVLKSISDPSLVVTSSVSVKIGTRQPTSPRWRSSAGFWTPSNPALGYSSQSSGSLEKERRKDAELEQLKVFQDRGMVIVVVSHKDLTQLAEGGSFISLLRTQYERVRLNLVGRKLMVSVATGAVVSRTDRGEFNESGRRVIGNGARETPTRGRVLRCVT